MEASREACRSVCTWLGLTAETQCLGDFWTVITIAQVRLEGFEGNDIDLSSMGIPRGEPVGWAGLSKLNHYQKHAVTRELDMMLEELPNLEMFDAQIRTEILNLATKVKKVIS